MKTIDRRIIVIAAAALTLIACDNSDENSLNVSGLQPEIQFIPMLEGTTRALQTGSDLSMETGDKFYVWADQRDPVSEEEDNTEFNRVSFFDEWELAVQAGVNRIAASRETKRYPAMNRVQFYAIHGNFSGEHSSVSGTDEVKCHFPLSKEQFAELENPTAEDLGPLLHSVENDQRTDGEGLNTNYTKSDLLYGIVPEMPASNSAVPLHFYHMLSKVVVNLMLGKGLTAAQLSTATVKIVNVSTKVMFQPKKVKFMDNAVETDSHVGVWMMDLPTELATLSGREDMLFNPTDVGIPNPPTQTIFLGTNVNQSEVCILPPQTFVEGEEDGAAIEITWNNTTKRIPLTGTIRSGMVYTYDVTVDHIGVGYSFAPTVTAWGTSGQREIDVAE